MNFTLAASKAGLKLKKHSPHILFGAGIVGMGATVVLSCRATLKVQPHREEFKRDIKRANEFLDSGQYNKEKHKQVVVALWTHRSVQYAKLFGPAFVLGLTSVACLTKSHQILTTRNGALMAAYTGLDSAFKAYRNRVVEELGLEKDTEFAHGVEKETITGYDEKGNGVSKEAKKAAKDAKTAYGRWFEESNVHWDKDPGYNYSFLYNQQKWANLELKRHGFLFLNDVYQILGFPKTAEGQQVGWYYDNDNGDGYVDFGFNRYPEFVNGYQRNVFLDFNVDGPILDFL